MKKYFLIISISFLTCLTVFGQDEPNDDAATKLQQRMKEYIQKRLNLSKAEAEKFSPVFLRYIVELRKTHRENRTDKPMLQLKVAEVVVRFRNEFRQILDEQRANRVFEIQREFEIKIRDELKNRQLENRPNRRTRALLRSGF